MAARLPAEGKVRRDSAVIADRARGLSWATVAQRHQLSERHRREIWTAGRTSDIDPHASLEALADVLAQLDAAIEDLALLAETTRNDAVQLGAIKARLTAMADRVEVLQAVGLLPHDLGYFQYQVEVRQIIRAVTDASRQRCPRRGPTRCAVRTSARTRIAAVR